MNTNKKLVALLVAGLSIALIAAIALVLESRKTQVRPETELNLQAVKVTQNLWLEDEKAALSGEESIIPKSTAMDDMGIAQATDAVTLSNDYAANEIAADQRHKVGKILVSGKVESVSKDFMNSPYVVLAGHSEFEGVQAHFDTGAEGALAQLHKGESIEVVCEVSGMVVTEVMMKDCRLLANYTAQKQPAIGELVSAALQGKQPVTGEVARELAVIYIMAKHLPENTSCAENADAACEVEIESLEKRADRASLKQEISTFAARLNVR